jgi:hypothetical protein
MRTRRLYNCPCPCCRRKGSGCGCRSGGTRLRYVLLFCPPATCSGTSGRQYTNALPGAPYTLGQAQAHISQSPLGRRITWVKQSPLDYLSSLPSSTYTSSPSAGVTKVFDAAVLAHCLWYFSSPSVIFSILDALRNQSKRLLVAEWSLQATRPSAQSHVLAALAQAALESHKSKSHSNIRTVLGPKRLTDLALSAGWKLESETRVQAQEGLLDGQWEVSACLSASFEKEVESYVLDEREKGVVLALRDACETSLQVTPGGRKGVHAMDIWIASFVCA